MQVGLIPPIPHLKEFGRGRFHLALSHLLDDSTYWDHYQKEADLGAFIVLDNSAHELGAGRDPVLLLEQALELGASELVCPDALFDSKRSVELTTQALEAYSRLSDFPLYELRIMVVPQGEDTYRWFECLKGMLDAFQKYTSLSPLTIGISKDYETWKGGIPHLLSTYIEPLREGLEFDTHLLGWGRQLHVLSTLAHRFPWIRSTDSAKPLVYACAGLEIEITMSNPQYPGRMPDYFNTEMTEEEIRIAWKNIQVFQARAGGQY